VTSPASGRGKQANDVLTSEQREALLVEYQQLRERHDGIADFRAKLLALLPLSSGTGIALLLRSKSYDDGQLAVVGVFGAIVTVGLFLYELRGIGHCNVLICRGSDIEQKLDLDDGMWSRRRAESERSPGKRRFVTTTQASWIVYLTVIAGWLYVAGYGLHEYV
jgi:hypothetical protein